MGFTQKPRVFVAGSTGMVGSAICRRLESENYPVIKHPGRKVDLRDQSAAHELLDSIRPQWVFLAAARVGGIYANNAFPAEFIYDNLMMQCNIMHACHELQIEKLLFLGSSCIYPRLAPQPMKEEYLLSGPLEPTNKPYAVAKIAGIVMAQSYRRQYGSNFISVMPSNLYGPFDNFDLKTSHVLPALLRKTHEAKASGAEYVEIWGSGSVLREFLHVDDLADACIFLMENYNDLEIVNIGSGSDISVLDLAKLIKEVVGFKGDLRFNSEMPDGVRQKLLDISRISELGWKPKIGLRSGLESTYAWYLENMGHCRNS
ncbi:MAG: GDP-L-fucose synthase [Deltaproteobacteria bacterium]|nr:GDP-L-fucose synthase [Deltaproteobacteria bacterium]